MLETSTLEFFEMQKFVQIGAKNFLKIHRKTLRLSLFLMKFAGLLQTTTFCFFMSVATDFMVSETLLFYFVKFSFS